MLLHPEIIEYIISLFERLLYEPYTYDEDDYVILES